MSSMRTKAAGRGARRRFTSEFKAGAIRLVLDEGKTIGAVARELDLTPSSLGAWVARAQADRTKGKTGLTSEERAATVLPGPGFAGGAREVAWGPPVGALGFARTGDA